MPTHQPSTSTVARCPACNTPLVSGRPSCVKCGMTRVKMAEFVKARDAASRRGVSTLIDKPIDRAPSFSGLRRFTFPAVVVAILIALAVGSYVIFANLHHPSPAPWLAYSTDPQQAAEKYITLASQDTVDAGRQAYQLVSLRVKHADDSDEVGRYRQLFHDMDEYFSGEFGPDWASHITYNTASTSASDQPVIEVHVATDVIHVQLEEQKPKAGPAPSPPHYGIAGIQEFPLGETSKSRQMAIASGVLGGVYGASGSVRQIKSIAALSSNGRETPFETKRRLLPILRDPRAPALHRCIIQCWPIRHDPTVRSRLTAITTDQRYDPLDQAAAKEVLEDRVDISELIGNGVPDSN